MSLARTGELRLDCFSIKCQVRPLSRGWWICSISTGRCPWCICRFKCTVSLLTRKFCCSANNLQYHDLNLQTKPKKIASNEQKPFLLIGGDNLHRLNLLFCVSEDTKWAEYKGERRKPDVLQEWLAVFFLLSSIYAKCQRALTQRNIRFACHL